TILGFGAALVYARPDWVRWKPALATAVFWLFAVALLTTQSRQAIVGLGVAILFIAWRVRTFDHKRSVLVAIATLPALAFVVTLVRDQVEDDNRFNSVFQRIAWYEEAWAYWQESLWTGHGLRFWYQGGPIGYQPPNAIIEVGTSAGVVGVVGFLAMLGGVLLVLWRMDARFGTVALAILLSRLVQSQLDLFWVAVQTSVPFLVAGIAVGALAHERAANPWGRTLTLVGVQAARPDGRSRRPAVEVGP
ncbi:O-antigen ligase family protein, partial [Propioniciclava sp.]|uniref:O-antigen ligase family protein n=1 Tax=Propioniciclava sp. TaxID=2038686 RepID=UPI002638A3DF